MSEDASDPVATPAADAPAPASEEAKPLGIFEPDEPEPEAAPEEKPAAVEVKPPEPKPEPMAPQFAKLARKEAKLRETEAALKVREAAAAEREKALQHEDYAERLKAIGVNYEQLTEYFLSGKKPQADAPESKEISALRAEVEKMQAAEATRDARAKEESVETFRNEVREFVVTNSEKYEYIRALGQEDMVFTIVHEYAKTNGKWLGGSQQQALELASEEVEKYLEERTEKALLTTKKFQNKISASTAARPPATSATQKPLPKTLSNSQAAAVPPRAPVEFTTVDETLERLRKQGLKIFDPD